MTIDPRLHRIVAAQPLGKLMVEGRLMDNAVKIDPRLKSIVAAQPYPLLFATISGAHLYGFPSPDSDFDLRGAHILPLEKVIGLHVREETVEQSMIVPP